MTKYSVVDNFELGYQNKIDITKLPPGVLVAGSQNVEVTENGRISHRKGYELDGEEGVDVDGGIVGSYDWINNSGTERNLRSGGNILQTRLVDSDGNVSYQTILSGVSPNFEFTTWWDQTEAIDILLGVNGGSGIYSWSGAAAQVDITGSTSNTLKLQDTTTNWAAQRFIVGGGSVTYDKKVVIGGTEYTYTGGETTDTLTGVSPDPTAGGHSDGDWGIQSVTLHADVPASDTTKFTNDIISTLYNQIWIGSYINREIYISSQSDFTDYALTNPRQVGDPAIFNLDGVVKAFAPNEEVMNVTAGNQFWYSINKELASDLSSEELVLNVLKAGANQGGISPGLTFPIKNSTAFISSEPTLDTLGKIENITTSQTVPLSDPIKNDFDVYDFGRGHGKFFQNDIYIALPLESKLLKYSIESGRWNPPWIMPAGRLAIINGELYLHSSTSFTTYKLFSGQSDNGNAIIARAVMSYQNNADRINKKSFTEKFTEGFISPNTTLTRIDNIEWEAVGGSTSQDISGLNSRIILSPSYGNPLGKSPLGEEPLGSEISEIPTKQRFRVIKDVTTQNYRELQVVFESNEIGSDWEITAFGHDVQNSALNNSDITI